MIILKMKFLNRCLPLWIKPQRLKFKETALTLFASPKAVAPWCWWSMVFRTYRKHGLRKCRHWLMRVTKSWHLIYRATCPHAWQPMLPLIKRAWSMPSPVWYSLFHLCKNLFFKLGYFWWKFFILLYFHSLFILDRIRFKNITNCHITSILVKIYKHFH